MVAEDKSALEFLYASAPELLTTLEALMALGVEEGAVEAYLRHSLAAESRDSKLYGLVSQALQTLAATRRDLEEGAEVMAPTAVGSMARPEQ